MSTRTLNSSRLLRVLCCDPVISNVDFRDMPPREPKPTERQGQYLAFIYCYSKLHRRAPAEADIQGYFSVSAPTVHQMILTLEAAGFVERTAGQARSLRVLLAADQIPHLE